MRKSIPFTLLFAAFFAAFAAPLAAQNIEQEISDLAQQWQAAFNRADATVLGSMYTDKVIIHNDDGTTTTTISKADIEASFANDFKENTLRTEVTVMRMMAQAGGKVTISGNFSNTGSNKKTGEAISQSGKYEHVVVQEAGVWKLCELKVMPGK